MIYTRTSRPHHDTSHIRLPMVYPDALTCFAKGETAYTQESCTWYGEIIDDGEDPNGSGMTSGQAADQQFQEGTYGCSPAGNESMVCPNPNNPTDQNCLCTPGMVCLTSTVVTLSASYSVNVL